MDELGPLHFKGHCTQEPICDFDLFGASLQTELWYSVNLMKIWIIPMHECDGLEMEQI